MKSLSILTISLLASNFVFSQVTLGIKAGLNINAMSRESYNSTGMPYAPSFSSAQQVGYHFGAFAQIPLMKRLYLQPELQLIQRGTGSGWERVRASYLDVPILLHFKTSERFAIEAGMVFSGATSAIIGETDVYDMFEHFTFGPQMGVAFQFTKNISAAASYYYGLNSALRMTFYNPDNSVVASDDYYNRSAQFSIRYHITRKTE